MREDLMNKIDKVFDGKVTVEQVRLLTNLIIEENKKQRLKTEIATFRDLKKRHFANDNLRQIFYQSCIDSAEDELANLEGLKERS